MKNVIFRLLSIIASLATIISILVAIERDMFKFSSEGDKLIIMVGNFNLVNLLLAVAVLLVIAMIATVFDLLSENRTYSDPNILDQP